MRKGHWSGKLGIVTFYYSTEIRGYLNRLVKIEFSYLSILSVFMPNKVSLALIFKWPQREFLSF